MNDRYAAIASPAGCYSSVDGVTVTQHSTSGCIRASTSPALASEARLSARVTAGETLDPSIRAAAEVHIRHFPHCEDVRSTRQQSIVAHARELIRLIAARACEVNASEGIYL